MISLVCWRDPVPHRLPTASGAGGFSIKKCCPPELWFAEGTDGPMEWKSSDARSSRCVYGKSFDGKAGFVSWAWFLHFANYRRDCYNFDSRFEEGLAKYQDDKKIHDTKRIPVMPPTLRGCANFIQRWIFANTPSGATSSAVIFSLIQTAIENVSDPYRYLSWLMSTAAEIDLSRPENVQILLPWNTPAECRTN